MSKPQKSTWLKKEEADAQREWYVFDMEGQVIGRAATKIASVLRGKHKPTYTPNVDTGDFVVVINAGKAVLTGNKLDDKMYRYHTGYMSGLRETPAGEMLENHPDRAIRSAVRGMLPKNRLGRKMLKKLKIYAGAEHDHAAQKPSELTA